MSIFKLCSEEAISQYLDKHQNDKPVIVENAREKIRFLPEELAIVIPGFLKAYYCSSDSMYYPVFDFCSTGYIPDLLMCAERAYLGDEIAEEGLSILQIILGEIDRLANNNPETWMPTNHFPKYVNPELLKNPFASEILHIIDCLVFQPDDGEVEIDLSIFDGSWWMPEDDEILSGFLEKIADIFKIAFRN